MSLWKTSEIGKTIVKIEEGINGGEQQESCKDYQKSCRDDVVERSVECSSRTVNRSPVAKMVVPKLAPAYKIRRLSSGYRVLTKTGGSHEVAIATPSDLQTVSDNAVSGRCNRKWRMLDINRSAISSSDNNSNALETAGVLSPLPKLGERHSSQQMDEMKALVLNLSKKLTELDKKVAEGQQQTSKEGNAPELELELPANIQLPLKSTEAVEHLESQLEDDNVKNALEAYLAAVGGSSIRERCWNVMAALLKNDLCQNYNWTGGSGWKESVTCPSKKAFSSMVKLVKVVKRVIMKTLFLNAASEDMLEMEISEWLRNWHDRQETFDRRVENRYTYSPIRLDIITDDDSTQLKWKRSRCDSSADGDEVSDCPLTESPMLLSSVSDVWTPATMSASSKLSSRDGSTSSRLPALDKFFMQTPTGSESPGDGACSETTPAGFQTILTSDGYQKARKIYKRAEDHLNHFSVGAGTTDGECSQRKGFLWTLTMTRALLEAIKEKNVLEQIDKRNVRNKVVYRQLAERIKEASGVYVTWKQVSDKWKSLKKLYYKLKGSRGSSGKARRWVHWDELEDLLAHRPRSLSLMGVGADTMEEALDEASTSAEDSVSRPMSFSDILTTINLDDTGADVSRQTLEIPVESPLQQLIQTEDKIIAAIREEAEKDRKHFSQLFDKMTSDFLHAVAAQRQSTLPNL